MPWAEETAAAEDAPEDPNTLNLEAREYGKIGAVHCGVTRDGMVSVGGRQAEVEDGAEHVDGYAASPCAAPASSTRSPRRPRPPGRDHSPAAIRVPMRPG